MQELQNRIDTIEKALSPEREIFSDPERLSEYIDEVFARLSFSFNEFGNRKNSALSDSEYHARKRGKEALIRLCAAYDERFKDKYPALCIPAQLIHMNAPCTDLSFDQLNRRYDYALAAAIYLLDALYDSDLFDEAAEYFPTSREELSSVYLPNLSDAVHSDDELRAMLLLIQKGSGLYPLLTGDTTAALPYREQFEAIVALIGDDRVNHAKERFIALLDSLADSLFACAGSHLEAMDTARRKLSAIQSAPYSDMTVSASDADERVAVLEQKADDLIRFYCLIQTIFDPDSERSDLYADIAAPEIGDPYELCFGFLMLSDSDHLRLYSLSYNALNLACQALPWAGMGVVDPDNTLGEIDIDYEFLASLTAKTPGWDNNETNSFLYKKRLPSPLLTERRQELNIAQLTFLSSGLVPPRHGSSISYTRALMNDSDLSDAQRELLYEYLALAYAINHKEPDYSALEDDDGDTVGSEDSAEIKQLRSEIKRLKSTIHQFERRNKDTESLLSQANKKLDAAAKELAELRTMIRQPDESVDDTAVSVVFPYTAKKRSVIIGGHESWRKAIRPLLENVRFISSSEQPNPNLILGCDVVWFQTNAMGHSGYYKIIDLVRKNHIKVCYFSYSSAEKCAEQFALEDSEELTDKEEAPEAATD